MIDNFLKELESFSQNLLEKLNTDLKSIRTNRPSIELVENVKVNIYDQILTIKHLGALSILPPRTIQISVWDKNVIGAISRALEETKMGFSISIDGQNIYVNLPELSSERRLEFMKLAKKLAEEAKIQLRQKRDEVIKKMRLAEEEKKISEDDVFSGKEKIQKIIDDINKKIDSALDKKLKELEE
jgi:ribosome recycling factor